MRTPLAELTHGREEVRVTRLDRTNRGHYFRDVLVNYRPVTYFSNGHCDGTRIHADFADQHGFPKPKIRVDPRPICTS